MKSRGFTIVELIIVIVVIAILTAVYIVAYNGIQQRAYDTAVKNDITALAKTIRLYEAENGTIPTAGSKTASPDSTKFPGITFSPSKNSYSTAVDNLFYCSGLKSGVFTFTISAQSKSGAVITYRSNEGITLPASPNPYTSCMNGWDGTSGGYSYGYHFVSSQWWPWTNGQ